MSAKASGQQVLKQLNDAGYTAYFVGGMVRDTVLGYEIYDADITTDALPEDVLALFDKTVATGLQHGTVTVVIDGVNVEVTTFRLDGEYLNNRHPDGVIFTRSLALDLARRDFTINAMAQALDGTMIDPFNGRADLEAGVIRAVGEPKKRFEEDALRILRGIRFVAKLGFDVEEETLKAMKACSHLLANLSLERIRKEFEGMIESNNRGQAFKLMHDYELFHAIPYFSIFDQYPVTALAAIDDFKLMLLLATHHLADSTSFVASYPLTKEEKKLIEDLRAIDSHYSCCDELDDQHLAMLLQYKFGIETLRLKEKFAYIVNIIVAHHTQRPYKSGDFSFTPYDLPIECRADLGIQPEEIIKLSKKAPGAWLNNLLTHIEEAVVLRKIENTRESILKWIEKRGIFNVEED